jgi:hypothetical protein
MLISKNHETDSIAIALIETIIYNQAHKILPYKDETGKK